ncbi:MAG: hypothetical protein KDI51_12520, partial [Xanthomonadales bacterium]|nr:hypothetical protein [Xanthomonadales bacterium]
MAGKIGSKRRHWLVGLGLLLASALLAQLAPLQERIDEAEALRDRDPAAAAEQLQALLREALGAGDELAVAESRRALAVQYNIKSALVVLYLRRERKRREVRDGRPLR